MRLSLPLLGAWLLPLLAAASPTPTSAPALHARVPVTPLPTPTVVPLRVARDDKFAPSLNLPSIAAPSIPSLSLNLPPETCTPGFPAYATPGKDGYVPAEACNALWVYSPNFGAAIVFAMLFGVLTIAHMAQAIKQKNGYCWVIIMAALWETGAYAFRAIGSKNQQSAGIATIAQILVLVAPIWVNAFAYMVFARIVHFFSPNRKVWFLSPSVLALIFVTLDIVSFITQLIGGGMAGPGSTPESAKKGLNIYMGGIGMQEAFIVIFTGLVIKFHRDQLVAERTGRLAADKVNGWRQLTWALYGCLVAITIRIIYRLAEFSGGMGADNPLPSNEPVLYVLESVPMWLAVFVWNIFHPGRFVKGPDAQMPRSWLSLHLCCCCGKRRCDDCNGKMGHAGPHQHQHHRLASDVELVPNQEMHGVTKDDRGRVTVNPFLETPQNTSHYREVSPEHQYSAQRPREFLG